MPRRHAVGEDEDLVLLADLGEHGTEPERAADDEQEPEDEHREAQTSRPRLQARRGVPSGEGEAGHRPITSVPISSTTSGVVVDCPGMSPRSPPPATPLDVQVTLNTTWVVTWYSWLGWPAEVCRYVYPQYVLWSWSGMAGLYGLPGPAHSMLPCPLPGFQSVDTGVATAVAEMPPTVAVAVIGCHSDGEIHSHDRRATTAPWLAGGAMDTVGPVRLSWETASWPTCAGVGRVSVSRCDLRDESGAVGARDHVPAVVRTRWTVRDERSTAHPAFRQALLAGSR